MFETCVKVYSLIFVLGALIFAVARKFPSHVSEDVGLALAFVGMASLFVCAAMAISDVFEWIIRLFK